MACVHCLGNNLAEAYEAAFPNQLELAYTRCMMGFLLFHPSSKCCDDRPWGGSLAKFVHHRLPGVKTTAVEITEVVAAATIISLCPQTTRDCMS
jgi:spermidine synthase